MAHSSGVASGVLISSRYRRPVWGLVGVCWVVTVALGVWFAGAGSAGRLDTALMDWVHAVAGDKGRVAELLVWPSSPPVVYAVMAATVVFALCMRRWELAALAVVGPALAVALVELVGKPLVHRHLSGYLSYPSGHTVSTVSVLTVAMVGLATGARIGLRVLALLIWLVITGAVMVGLVAMNYHYATDTVGGLGVALGIVPPLAILTDVAAIRRARSRLDQEPSISSTSPSASGSDTE